MIIIYDLNLPGRKKINASCKYVVGNGMMVANPEISYSFYYPFSFVDFRDKQLNNCYFKICLILNKTSKNMNIKIVKEKSSSCKMIL